MKRALALALAPLAAVLALVLLVPVLVVVIAVASTAAPAGGGFGTVRFADTFDGSTLGPAWSVFNGDDANTGPRAARNVSVHDGVLDLTVAPTSGRPSAWGGWAGASLCACTASSGLYGRYLVRAMSTTGDNWRRVALTWPDHHPWPPELDLLEATSTTSNPVTTHWPDSSAPRGDGQQHGSYPADLGQWHTYGTEWTPGSVVYTLDGVPQVTHTGHVPAVPMWLGLTAAMHAGGQHPTTPQHYLVDSVEVDNYAPGTAAGGTLKPGSVPAQYVTALQAAGAICPIVTAPLLAAQIQQESGWNPQAVSPAGAEGLSQFMPGTWATWGRDVNNDGTADPFDPYDAIDAQARYDCALAAQVAHVPGDPVSLMLAAYNAGPGAVIAAGGIPPIAETQQYVRAILALLPDYTAPAPTGATGTRGAVVQLALSFVGVPYQWGGDSPAGFDCSGLTSYVYAHAAGITLPHHAADQQTMGTPVATPQPGDLVFFGNPAHHVGIALGNGQMVDAPHTGATVRVEPIWPDVSGYVALLP